MKPFLTKQQAVYRQLRAQIMRVELPPGRRLVIDDIARAMEVSAIPVREALQLLQAERLIETHPHAGAVVAPIMPAAVEELFSILEGLESAAVRLVARNYAPELSARLGVLNQKMDTAAHKNDYEDWSALNLEFHKAMSRATGMPLLMEMTERTLEGWNRIRRFFFHKNPNHRMPQAQKEHGALLKAFQNGQWKRAEALIQKHNQNAFRHYSDLLRIN